MEFRQYQNLIDDMRMPEANIPTDCPCTDTFDDVQQSVRVCHACGHCVAIVCYQNDFRDRGHRRNYQPYKRLNHFLKTLSFIRKKPRMVIPSTILHFVKRKCKTITSNNIRNVLKASKLTKYIPYVILIYETLTNKQAPYLSINEFNSVVAMFRKIDRLYDSIQKNRIQFFNYSFLIKKLLERIGRKDCADFFKPLKNQARHDYQTKLYQQVIERLP